jgi:ABC-type Na+ efflux pump permease subunit
MGKAAENEKTKLRANFLNNCAAALCIAGGLLPILAVYVRIPDFAERQPSFTETLAIICAGLAIILAVATGLFMHFLAIKQLNNLED